MSSLPDAVPRLVGHEDPGLGGVPVAGEVVTLLSVVKTKLRPREGSLVTC